MRANCQILLLWAYAVFLSLYPTNAEAQHDDKELRVTIIVVSHFDDPELADMQLDASTERAGERLRKFFEGNKSVVPELFNTKETTSAKYIRNWLFHDLASATQRSLHLVFFLTHGFAQTYPDKTKYKSEIFLATSDTFKNEFFGTAIRGSELLEAFHDTSGSSTIFLFLDSCGSGTIDSDNLQEVLLQDPEFANRLLLLASAMPEESAYMARFTNALVNIWEAKEQKCHKGESEIEKFVSSSLNSIPGVSGTLKQNVRLVAPLSPELCIESFGLDQRLALFYNAAREDVLVTIQSPKGEAIGREYRVKRRTRLPVYLAREKYRVIASAADENSKLKSEQDSLDLVSQSARFQPLFASDDLRKAEAEDAAAAYFEYARVTDAYQQINTALQADLKTLKSDYEKRQEIAEGLQQAKEELESQNKHFADAKSRYEIAKAEADAKSTGPAYIGQQKELKNATQRYETAQKDREKAKLKLHKAENLNEQFRGLSFDLDEAERMLPLLMERVEYRQAQRNAQERAASQLARSLPPEFRVENTGRGIVIQVHSSGELTSTIKERYEAILRVIDPYDGLQIEVEQIAVSDHLPKQQEEVRAEAERVRQFLISKGFPAGRISARGLVQSSNAAQFVSSQDVLRLVLSGPFNPR